MTRNDQGQPADDQWLTLTEAAQHSGHTREAIRQRVRRRVLRATKGNDGQLRVQARDLDDLPPPDPSGNDRGQQDSEATDAALAVLKATVADLRADLEHTRTTLDAALADRLADYGRAERAEGELTGVKLALDRTEGEVRALRDALEEAQRPAWKRWLGL